MTQDKPKHPVILLPSFSPMGPVFDKLILLDLQISFLFWKSGGSGMSKKNIKGQLGATWATRRVLNVNNGDWKFLGNNKAKWTNICGRCFNIEGSFYGKYYQEQPEHSEELFCSIWAYTFSFCSWEKPKPNIFKISGFWSPQDPLFMDLNIPNYSQKLRSIQEHVFNMLCL